MDVPLVLLLVLLVAILAWRLLERLARYRRALRPIRTVGGDEDSVVPPFPSLAAVLPPKEQMFERIREAAKNARKPPKNASGKNAKKWTMSRVWPKDALEADALSSHYTEDVRARCRFGGRPSPLDVWNDAEKRAAAQADAAEFEPHPLAAYEGLYKHARWCNFYNPTFCLWINRTLGSLLKMDAKDVRILDPSAGWGDRMLAACALGAKEYHGFDPNSELAEAYAEIAKDFAPDDRKEAFRVETAPFEAADVPTEAYDIVHTSPPFYDLEDYPAEGCASAAACSGYKEWLEIFYLPYLNNAWGAVRPGGYLVLYVSNFKDRTLASDTQEHIKAVGGREQIPFRFRQAVDWAGTCCKGPVRTAYVWKKTV
jgi:hypothetical protein